MSPRKPDPAPADGPDRDTLVATVAQLSEQLAEAEARLREMGISDATTGLFSYRYFLGRMAEEVARADRFNLEVSCLMLRVDLPSLEGVVEVAGRLKEACRQYDIPARWGQHELVMLLPATDLDGAQTFAERFRLQIEEAHQGHASLPGLTISVGVAIYPRVGVEDAEQLLAACDEAAFRARGEGGNRTVVRR
ncbi:MAG: GGDEF domain-containing protein [Candidatus Sericytochromatia bacterium]|nr:GGDEF domain-containing protein [Candidatus Sericytochromatia bacterium]